MIEQVTQIVDGGVGVSAEIRFVDKVVSLIGSWEASRYAAQVTDWVANGGAVRVIEVDAFEVARESKRDDIRAAFEVASVQPVTAGGFTWNGGYDSALRLDGERRACELSGLTTCVFYDVDNQPHLLTLNGAVEVILAVTNAFRAAYGKKQALMASIKAATTNEELNAIQW